MSGLRLLDLVKPFVPLLPEIELPYQKQIFDDKIVYTLAAAGIYVSSSIPINSIFADYETKVADPFYWLRSPFGSTYGSFLEFGLLPIITAGFLWQILAGFKLIKVNFELSRDRELFQSLQKLTAIFLGVVYAVLLTLSGHFNPVDAGLNNKYPELNTFWSNLLIISQLASFSTIITLMIEILDKGYGFGPGILALIAATNATNLSTGILGLTTFLNGKGKWESSGAIVNLIRGFFSKPLTTAVFDAFTRENLTNLTQVYLTLAVVAIVAYLSNCRNELPIKSLKVRSMVSVYPIKLLYCGALPVIFSYAILYNLNIFAFSLTKILPNVEALKYLAVYKLDTLNYDKYDLESGLLYFLSPSLKSDNPLFSLIRPVTFLTFIVSTSILFAKNWSNVSGSSGKDLAKQLKEQEITLVGHRDVNIAKELNKIIPVASTTGAFALSFTIGLAEATGLSKGFSIGVAVGVTSALGILEQVMTEWQQSGGASSQFAQVFNPNS